MAKLIKHGDTIVAKHTDGHTRKYNWKGPKRHPKLKKIMTLYECDRNSYAEVIKECDDQNILSQLDDSYNRSLGDCLDADAISMYIDTKGKKVDFEVEGGATGRHKANSFKLRQLSICCIKTPLHNLEKSILKLEQPSTSKIEEK